MQSSEDGGSKRPPRDDYKRDREGKFSHTDQRGSGSKASRTKRRQPMQRRQQQRPTDRDRLHRSRNTDRGTRGPSTSTTRTAMEVGADNDPQAVKELQRLLRRFGLGRAPINGRFGTSTANAVKALQERLGMRPTGRASKALVNKLKAAAALCGGGRATEAEALDWLAAEVAREAMDYDADCECGGGDDCDCDDMQEATMPDLDELGADAAWSEAVTEHVTEAAARYGADPAELLDSLEFFARLDHVAEAEADDPELERAIEAAVAEHVGVDDRATESTQDIRMAGRVLEAKGEDANGGRVYRVRMLRYGDSKNRRRYSEGVMRRSAHLYEGAPAFDRHRSTQDLTSSTIAGLVGQYRNVSAETDGLYGDLHLLPSATHAAEALDASLAATAAGLPPLVGVSHDIRASFRAVPSGRGHVQECTAIEKVQSTDLVTDPSAGGAAVRALAGGTEAYEPDTDSTETEEDDVPTTESVLAAIRNATDADLAAVGLTRAGTPTTRATEATAAAPTHGEAKASFLGKLMVERAVEAAGLAPAVAASLTEALPERITEADVDAQIAALKSALGIVERAGLAPTVTTQVVRESRDKKIDALDAFFAGDFMKGYRSFKTAYMDITGRRPDAIGGADFNRQIIRESYGGGFDSAERVTESADTSTWAQLLGDSVTRRVVAEYGLPSLQTWRRIVSDIQPVDDFRTQRVGRMGGYGVLPTVLEGGPYQPLTTPADEEATYALAKKGGTEDLTLETIANDDRRVISKIPTKLGRAAAQTLYRFVWDMLVTPVTCTYDSVALFHASHSNTAGSSALSQTTLAAGRLAMRDQAAYGDTSEILSLQPKFLVVPNELEELAFQLTTSAVAVPATPAGPSDTPNINRAQGLEPILVSYLTDANDWFLVADPAMTPTIEVGFYQGREEPEIFTQSDNTVGSAFNNDVITWKIRHIYSGTALDHRGFYRGQG